MIFDAAVSRIKLLVQLRWLVLILQAAGMYPALKLGWLDPRWTSAYVVTILSIAGVNLLFSLWSARSLTESSAPEWAVFSQMGMDAVGLAILLSLMSGPWNPLAAMFYVQTAMSCALLRGRWRGAYLGLILALFLALHLVHDHVVSLGAGFLLTSPVLLFSQFFVACLIWIMAKFLMGHMQEQHSVLVRLGREREQTQRLEAINATAAGFAHKFATPLSNLKQRLKRLQAAANPATQADLASMAVSLAEAEDHLQSIIARTAERRSGGEIRLQAVDVREFLLDFVKVQTAGGVAMNWQDELPNHVPCLLPVKEVREALQDLVDNAREAAETLQPIVIQGRCGAEAGTIELLIRDAGPGFPSIVQERFGEPFLTTKLGGTGLGLYNAKNLFWALGGHLTIGNLPTGGVVTVHLPLEGTL